MSRAGQATAEAAHFRPQTMRAVVYRVLETAGGGDRLSLGVDLLLVALILASVVAVILESMAGVAARHAAFFYWFEVVTAAVFSVEYMLRVWSCVENDTGQADARTALAIRLRYMLSFHALVDLVAILPFFLVSLGLVGSADMRFLRTVRLLRVLKLARDEPALNLLVATFIENGRSLAAAFFILLTVMLLAASGIYYFERDAQPVAFGSIPAAMWWAFVTLTTVGYGDVTPITVGGKIFGACITVGLGMVALPTGILATGFAEQLRQRSAHFVESAKTAWDDGVLTEAEKSDLERLRVNLGLGKHTASQILDTEMVGRMIDTASAATCPHCGAAVPER